jgi:bla regulator protein BlaR1
VRSVVEILAAVLNSLWQAALVAGVVWLALRLLRGTFLKPINAATRYAIWWAVLAVTLALPAAPRVVAWWHARARPALEAGPSVATPRPTAVPVIDEPPAIMTLREERTARWPVWVLAAWVALCLYRLFQIGRSYVYLRGVKRRAIASQAALPPILRRARLLLSNEIASPMAVGFLHPAVILPESLPGELAQPEMEHVLLHEAAHIARMDDWTNLLARLLGAALALHPMAWWILRQIEREREIACDDWVVARTGSARPYAQSLARISELRWSKRGPAHGTNQGEALASEIFGGGSRLGERIEMLLARGRVFYPRASMGRVAASAVLLLGCVIAAALTPRLIVFAQAAPQFEVASVKREPWKGQGSAFAVTVRGDTLTGEHVTLSDLVRFAYKLRSVQLSGGPSWVFPGRLLDDSDLYQVIAKATGDPPPPMDQFRQMLQGLLADRFKLKIHHVNNDLPAYNLVLAKNGPKIKESAADAKFSMVSTGNIHMLGTNVPLTTLVDNIEFYSGHPVFDKTGLTGNYDFDIQWVPDNRPGAGPDVSAPDSNGPTLFTALQEQLGLKLEPGLAPFDTVVIDHAEKPDAN